jgi:multidrug resistance efflux pump
MKTERDYLIDAAQRNAREAIAQARSALERSLRQIDNYTKQFESKTDVANQAKIMNWLLNELACNILPNLGMSDIANAQQELARLANQE